MTRDHGTGTAPRPQGRRKRRPAGCLTGLDAMIGGYNAEVALCRQELGSGTSPQARALARSMLAERQSELARRRQRHQDPHMGMMG